MGKLTIITTVNTTFKYQIRLIHKMVRNKCPSCAKKIEKKFSYCPYCGESFKQRSEKENYGFLGREDTTDIPKENQEIRLPFGLNKMVESLAKQLERQITNMDFEQNQNMPLPKGFKIKISTGQQPQIIQEQTNKKETKKELEEHITETEQKRRNKLPKKEAESKIKRLADKIIYEIQTPGIQKEKDVTIIELATGIEIKAYTKNTCYTKYIPIKTEITNYYIEGKKLIVECKT
jgi:predicted RNA-binding Zn-ribbon protein involved in translation (DUF1610 family)